LFDPFVAGSGSGDGDGAILLRSLQADRIRQDLAADPFYTRVVVAETLTSTNDEARRLAAEGAAEGTVVLANTQSAGRGRHGRVWISSPGLGLYASVVLRPVEPVERVTRWTLGASVAACEACREVCGRQVEIDWPNDLVYRGRKLAGILAEMRSAGGLSSDLVIGVGINVHHRDADLPPAIVDRATSLHLIGGTGILEREQLAASYLARFAGIVSELRGGGWDRVVSRWEALAPGSRGLRGRVLPGRREDAGRAFVGVTRGLDPDGALVVEDDVGRTRVVRMVDSFVPLES
jgi:BirA family biotin operon repressor/biotin-[acetyl-CoA-carboxylase] ligase